MSTPDELERRVNRVQLIAHGLDLPVSLVLQVETLLAFEAMNAKLEWLIKLSTPPTVTGTPTARKGSPE